MGKGTGYRHEQTGHVYLYSVLFVLKPCQKKTWQIYSLYYLVDNPIIFGRPIACRN